LSPVVGRVERLTALVVVPVVSSTLRTKNYLAATQSRLVLAVQLMRRVMDLTEATRYLVR
jgi:hypothetical protein